MKKNFYKVSDRYSLQRTNCECGLWCINKKTRRKQKQRLFRKLTDYLESQIIHKNDDTHITLNTIIYTKYNTYCKTLKFLHFCIWSKYQSVSSFFVNNRLI